MTYEAIYNDLQQELMDFRELRTKALREFREKVEKFTKEDVAKLGKRLSQAKQDEHQKRVDEFAAAEGKVMLVQLDWENVKAAHEQKVAELEKQLAELAPTVELKPLNEDFMAKLDVSDVSAYRSQTQPEFYAEHELTPLLGKLEQLGFKAEVRRVTVPWVTFALWANCLPWQYDALRRTFTMDEALAILKARCRTANPFVLFPTLARLQPDLLSTYWS